MAKFKKKIVTTYGLRLDLANLLGRRATLLELEVKIQEEEAELQRKCVELSRLIDEMEKKGVISN